MKKLFSILLCLTILLLSSCAPSSAPSSDGTTGSDSDAVFVETQTDSGDSSLSVEETESDTLTDSEQSDLQSEQELPQNPPFGPQIYTYDSETRKVLSQEELNAVVGEDVKGAWIFEDSEEGDEIVFSATFPGPYPGRAVENAVAPEPSRANYSLGVGGLVWGTYQETMYSPYDAGVIYHQYKADDGGIFGLTEDETLCLISKPLKFTGGSTPDPERTAEKAKDIYKRLSGKECTVESALSNDQSGCLVALITRAGIPSEKFADGTLFAPSFWIEVEQGQTQPYELRYFPREHSDEVKALQISTVGIDAALREVRYMVEQQGKEFCRASARYAKFFYGADGEAYGVYEVSFALSDRLPQLVTDCLVACRLTGSDAVS